MKKLSTLLLLLLSLAALSQTKLVTYKDSGYQVNNAQVGLDALFDGNLTVNFKPSNATMILVPPKDRHTIVYRFAQQQHAVLNKIRIFDYTGDNNASLQGHPDTVKYYAKRVSDNARIYIGYYIGSNYNQWDSITIPMAGATTGAVSVYSGAAFETSEVIAVGGNAIGNTDIYGTEWEFWGTGNTFTPDVAYSVTKHTFGQLTGINGYPYYNDTPSLNRFRYLANFRSFMDWERVEPVKDSTWFGTWNWDEQLKNLHLLGFYSTVTVQRITDFIKQNHSTTSQDSVGYDFTPTDSADMNKEDPRNYSFKSNFFYVLAGRYGTNSSFNTAAYHNYMASAVHSYWANDTVKKALGYLDGAEEDNECDRTWRYRYGYSSGREMAAQASALYDGYGGRMSGNYGAKNADPGFKILMPGIASPQIDYLYAARDWCIDSLGLDGTGHVRYPWDILNIHMYMNTAGTSQTGSGTGSSPEAAGLPAVLDQFMYFAGKYGYGMPVHLSETGYDQNPGSPQAAPAIATMAAEDVRGVWFLRTALICWWKGVERLTFYQGNDDTPGSPTRHMTDGLFDNASQGGPRPRGATNYLIQAESIFSAYLHDQTLSTGNPYVLRGALSTDTAKKMYVLWKGTQNLTTINYILSLPVGYKLKIYTPDGTSQAMGTPTNATVTSGAGYSITVSEVPVFVEATPGTIAPLITLPRGKIYQYKH